MQILKKKLKKQINMIIIKGINVDNINSAEKLKNIIKRLMIGEGVYFHFRSENNFFLTEEEIYVFRNRIPAYLSSNGKYKMKYKVDDERFDSIGYLPINEDSCIEILEFWRYFDGVTFFAPSKLLDWEKFEEKYDKIKPEEYGIGIIQNKFADSVFIKGHDGDNLIFVYGLDYDENLVREVIQSIGNC